MIENRLARQKRFGGSALMAAVGLLAGVMLATVADDDTVPVAGDATYGVGSSGSGLSAGDGTTLSSDGTVQLADGTTTDLGGASGDGAGPVTGSPGGATTGSGGGGGAGGAGRAGSSGGGNSGASARGVTGEHVKIGVAYLDLSALAQFPQFRIVPGDKAVQSVYDGLKRRGEIPIHGRDVVFQRVDYNVLNPEDQRAACQRLVKDAKVFAVAAHTVFDAGAECTAKDEKTPTVMPDPVPAAAIQAGAPYYFSLSMTIDTMGRNLVHFSKAKGLLDGKKLGMYYADDNASITTLARETKAMLNALGYSLAAEQKRPYRGGAAEASPQPQPDDYLAVQRFQQAGVETAFLFGTQGRFMQAAEQQGYKAQYVNTDHSVGASDTTVSAYPPDQFDGAYAFTGTRRQEYTTGRLSPTAQQCLDDYAATTGDRIDVVERESEWGSLAMLCDVLYATVAGLKQAGPTLTHASYVQGLERVRNLHLVMQGVTTWGPGRHAGGDGYRTLLWKKEWGGYRVQQPFDFQRLWVP